MWFQTAAIADQRTRTSITIFHPDHPIPLTVYADTTPRETVTCLSVLRTGSLEPVTPEDPARPGDVVRVLMTGLAGEEPVPFGEPNPTRRPIPVASPPAVAGDGLLEVLSFILSPEAIGLQQLDLRIKTVLPRGPLFPDSSYNTSCLTPPIR